MMISRARPRRSSRSVTGGAPYALIALVVIPALAGALRIIELAGGPHILPANERMTASPVPVVIHVLAAVPYCVVGAFQFAGPLRGAYPGWHRSAGRVSILCGLAVALSGLWMTLGYAQQPGTGVLAVIFRVGFGSALAAALILGYVAIRRGAVATHRAWMMRAYAIALAAGTQTFTLAVGPAVFGSGAVTKDLSLGAGWLINVVLVEAIIRRTPRSSLHAGPQESLRRAAIVPVSSP